MKKGILLITAILTFSLQFLIFNCVAKSDVIVGTKELKSPLVADVYPNPTNNNLTIDVSPLPRGMYFVEVTTEKGIALKKFVKE